MPFLWRSLFPPLTINAAAKLCLSEMLAYHQRCIDSKRTGFYSGKRGENQLCPGVMGDFMKLFKCTCKRFFTPCDPGNCRHEAEQELIELDQRGKHDDGECEKAPVCGYCLDELDRGNNAD